ncbi:MAG: RNA polymerase sigma factor [Armatimonadetes bacterium]|nr:RNA polymerase sigma factor [Armatimonadota bacterium]
MARTDAEIVAAVRGGDVEAFRELVERYHQAMLATARHTLGNADLAQDVAQETFIEAFRGIHNLRHPERFRAWLHGILRYRCLKAREFIGPATVPYEDGVGNWTVPAPEPEDEPILSCLKHLSHADRELLTARYVQDLSYEEIARLLRVKVGAVRVRCLRARERLRQVLACRQTTEREVTPCG